MFSKWLPFAEVDDDGDQGKTVLWYINQAKSRENNFMLYKLKMMFFDIFFTSTPSLLVRDAMKKTPHPPFLFRQPVEKPPRLPFLVGRPVEKPPRLHLLI